MSSLNMSSDGDVIDETAKELKRLDEMFQSLKNDIREDENIDNQIEKGYVKISKILIDQIYFMGFGISKTGGGNIKHNRIIESCFDIFLKFFNRYVNLEDFWLTEEACMKLVKIADYSQKKIRDIMKGFLVEFDISGDMKRISFILKLTKFLLKEHKQHFEQELFENGYIANIIKLQELPRFKGKDSEYAESISHYASNLYKNHVSKNMMNVHMPLLETFKKLSKDFQMGKYKETVRDFIAMINEDNFMTQFESCSIFFGTLVLNPVLNFFLRLGQCFTKKDCANIFLYYCYNYKLGKFNESKFEQTFRRIVNNLVEVLESYISVNAMYSYPLIDEACSNHSYRLQEFPCFLTYFRFENSCAEFIASPEEEYSFVNYMYYDNIVKTAQLLNILYSIKVNGHKYHNELKNSCVIDKIHFKSNFFYDYVREVSGDRRWITDLIDHCPFLIKLENRKILSKNAIDGFVKIKLKRDNVFEQIIEMANAWKTNNTHQSLEFYFEDNNSQDVTKEILSTFSREIQKKNLRLWIDDSNDATYASYKNGLFPRPAVGNVEDKSKYYVALGMMMGVAFSKDFKLEIPLSSTLFKFLHIKTWKKIVYISMFFGTDDLKTVCPVSAKFIDDLDNVVQKKKSISGQVIKKPYYKFFLKNPTIEKKAIDKLGVYFTLPGFPEEEFVPNGKNILLTKSNIEEYFYHMKRCFIGKEVESQLLDIAKGISLIMPLNSMKSFSPNELKILLLENHSRS